MDIWAITIRGKISFAQASKSGLGVLLLCAVFFFLFPNGATLYAQTESADSSDAEDSSPWYVPVKTVSIITTDDQGLPLKFPSSVYFDKTMDEIYVVSGGTGRINVYGADYFPRISLGAGRGIDSPNGVYVANDGRLFVCQGRSATRPPRLTILNAAFFPLQEIITDDIPGTESFIPSRVAVGLQGKIYVSGINFRGVIVLDKDGTFLHWLKPRDKIWVEDEDAEKAVLSGAEGAPAGEEAADVDEVVEEDLLDAEMSSLPDFLRPKKKVKEEEEEDSRTHGPVQITDVKCGKEGHIYLLSEETSKVYVYSASEEFLFSFGQKGGSSGKLSRPRGLAVDEEKKCVYVVDYMRHTVLVYNFAGRYLFEIGGKGRAPRWFNFPTALALNRQGNLIVADLFNQRVQVLDVQFEAGFSLFGPGGGAPE